MPKPKEQKFVLLSLKDNEAKRLGQVISSETARKILDALAEKKYTETELAEKLRLPLSTVHYNMKALVEAKLVTADEYHYSEKGREVIHYGLANKYVIIAPASTQPSILNKLKTILPVAVLVAAVGWSIDFFMRGGTVTSLAMPEAMPTAMRQAAPAMMEEAADVAAKTAAEQTAATMQAVPEPATGLPIGLWFTIGAAFAVTLYILIEALRSKWR